MLFCLSADDSIFDMSQSTPLTSPARRPTRATSELSRTSLGEHAAASQSGDEHRHPQEENAQSSRKRPARAAVLQRRSYKEAETQPEESYSTQNDTQNDDGDTDMVDQPLALHTPTATPRRQKPTAGGSGEDAPLSAYKQLKDYSPIEIPVDACAVCGGVSEDDPVVQCRLCKVQVHSELCYGPAIPLTTGQRANWYCDRCSESMGTKHVTCCVCPNTDDQAFKRTDTGEWIHASCATWLTGPKWRDPSKRNIVYDVSKIESSQWHTPCKFCTGKGAVIQCTYGHNTSHRCRFMYHVPCGVRFGIFYDLRGTDELSQEEIAELDDDCDDVFFHSFCKAHADLAHEVKTNNSFVATVSARKRKKKGVRRGRARKDTKGKKGQEATKSEKEEVETEERSRVSEGDDDSDCEPWSKRLKTESDKRVNRSINLADTSIDTTGDSSAAATPLRAGDALFRSLFHAPSSSPFLSPTVEAPIGTTAAATFGPESTAIRKLAFSPPAIGTTSIGISTRSSPGKVSELPTLMRAASAGTMTSSQASAASSMRPQLTRTSSLRNPMLLPAAAAASSTISPQSSRSRDVSRAPTPSSTFSRPPLRSMGRDEVASRDAAAKNFDDSLSTPALPKSRALGRRQIVLLGTKLADDQQKLLEELAAELNQIAKADKSKSRTEKPVYVQSHFDDSVTHVVTTTSESENFLLQSRTVKYFQGLVAGCWVVGVDWVSASLCARKLVDESDYLVRGDAKFNHGEVTQGAKRARNQSQRDFFRNMHFVWRPTTNSKESTAGDVRKLIEMGGGVVSDVLPGVHTARRKSKQLKHDSDLEDADSQSEILLSESSPMAAVPAGSLLGPVIAGARWFLLVDDTVIPKAKGSKTPLQHLKSYVTPADWNHCVQHGIDIVGVSWLFDSISAFRIQPTEKLRMQKDVNDERMTH